MKLTIIPTDGAVYKDNFSFSGLELTVPTNVHALQWNETKGWVEFKQDENFYKPANEVIEVLPAWALAAVVKWEEAKAAEEAFAIETAPIEVTTP